MQVIVKLFQSALGDNSPDSAAVSGIISSMGLVMRRMHPGTQDSVLSTYYFVEADDPTVSKRLIEALLQSRCVDGAYIKPSDTVP